MNKKICVLSLSGGMDSTGLLLNLIKNEYTDLYILSFYYGQKHNIELKRAKKNITYIKKKLPTLKIEHKLIDLSEIMGMFNSALTSKDIEVPEGHYSSETMKSTVVPNRNAIFSSLLFGYALSISTKEKLPVDIALGVHGGDHAIYPDCRPEFYTSILKVFKEGNWESENVNFYLPFLNDDKFTILTDAYESCKKLKLSFNRVFANTNTCYKPNEKGESCKKCGSCTERLEAFTKLGMADPVLYSI